MEIDRWVKELEGLHERISECFVRPEPRQRALTYLRGLLGPAVRKNGWQLAEQIGEATPTGVQRLLREAHWDVEAVAGGLRQYVKQRFGSTGGVLVVDETPFRKKGTQSAGVKRQYCSTTGHVENCQVGVFLYDVPAAGRGAFLDRALYVPEDWLADRPRCRAAGVPDAVSFQTEGSAKLNQAGPGPSNAATGQRGGVPARLGRWRCGVRQRSAGALALEAWRWASVLGIRTTEPVRPAADGGLSERPAGAVAAALPAAAWRRMSAGEGTKGPRWFDWAVVPLVHLTATTGSHALLVRRAIADPSDRALFLVFSTRATTLADMVAAAGQRGIIEVGFEAAKGEVGLDHDEVRQWHAWYRHITLVLLAYAVLAVIRVRTAPTLAGTAGLPADPADPARDPPPDLPRGADHGADP